MTDALDNYQKQRRRVSHLMKQQKGEKALSEKDRRDELER